MGMNGVQQFIIGQLAGLTSEYYAPAVASLQVLIPDKITSNAPHFYVMSSSGSEVRRTAPFPDAYKELTHQVEVYVVMIQPNRIKNASGVFVQDRAFPSLMDAMMAKLRSIDPDTIITDPDTGVTSSLLNVGEDMKWRYAIPEDRGNQIRMLWQGLITMTIKEWIDG